ncbi:hypothetical protein T484DRAFT_1953731 [Baffinella frigidus]|nr:hypothetical protein T484DRAFT_1953731 [Cryptophyta sp. CCMP2293]|mmetsp:Transcript_39344/g.93122  ORF Transcript_39344/g.93122 Transcript_39344/m.93122 type:complete len:310 (-) Transcript_39344:130-1059(-)
MPLEVSAQSVPVSTCCGHTSKGYLYTASTSGAPGSASMASIASRGAGGQTASSIIMLNACAESMEESAAAALGTAGASKVSTMVSRPSGRWEGARTSSESGALERRLRSLRGGSADLAAFLAFSGVTSLPPPASRFLRAASSVFFCLSVLYTTSLPLLAALVREAVPGRAGRTCFSQNAVGMFSESAGALSAEAASEGACWSALGEKDGDTALADSATGVDMREHAVESLRAVDSKLFLPPSASSSGGWSNGVIWSPSTSFPRCAGSWCACCARAPPPRADAGWAWGVFPTGCTALSEDVPHPILPLFR